MMQQKDLNQKERKMGDRSADRNTDRKWESIESIIDGPNKREEKQTSLQMDILMQLKRRQRVARVENLEKKKRLQG